MGHNKRGNQRYQGHQPHDDYDDVEDDDEVDDIIKDDDNNKDNNNNRDDNDVKGIATLGLDRDLGVFARTSRTLKVISLLMMTMQ